MFDSGQRESDTGWLGTRQLGYQQKVLVDFSGHLPKPVSVYCSLAYMLVHHWPCCCEHVSEMLQTVAFFFFNNFQTIALRF